MDKQIAKRGNNLPAKSLDEEWGLMNAALERLGYAKASPVRRGGRLIVALDLTSSRAESLRRAQKATAQMFAAIKSIGSVAVKLIYYRGWRECKASAWHDDADVVSRLMLRLSCKAGNTQIARVLKLALKEKEKVQGLVLIVDHNEEDGWDLDDLAVKLGQKGIPLFIFHEVRDQDSLALQAQSIFEHMAKVSGGVYAEFSPDAGEVMHELLSTVAAFSAAGREGVKQVGTATTPEARQLQTRLLLGPAGEC